MRQVLYPGAPLFDSPTMNQNDLAEDHPVSPPDNFSDTEKSTSRHRRDLFTYSLPVVKALQSSSGLNQAVQCLNMSLSRYAEAKRSLTQELTIADENIALDSSKTQENPGIEDAEEEYLPGLNLVTFPDSLNRIEMIAVELERSTKQNCLKHHLISRTKPNIHSPPVNESPSRNIQIPTIENHFETPRTGVVVGAGIVEAKGKGSKSAAGSSIPQPSDKQRISQQSSSQSPSISGLSNLPRKSEEKVTDVKEALDWGERIRLLKRPSTWAKELAEQTESVHKDGCRRSRQRPTEPKVITLSKIMPPVTLRNDNKPQLSSNLSKCKQQNSLSTQSKSFPDSISNSRSITRPSKPKEISVTSVKSSDILDNRLNQLDDSTKELLSYYRHKVETLIEDHEAVQRRLDKIYDAIGNQESLSLELNQRDAEISELQRALSDMQVYLFQEREHVLRLYAENDRLKIRELDDRRKIQHLLQLSSLGPNEVTYFLKQPTTESHNVNDQEILDNETNENIIDENQKTNNTSKWISAMAVKPIIPTAPSQGVVEFTASGKTVLKSVGNQAKSDHKTCSNQSVLPNSDKISRTEHEFVLRELEMSKSSLRALQTQLEEQTRNSREQIDSLMEDRKTIQEEMNSLRKRYEEKIRTSSEQLKRCQELLYDSTKEFLAQRNQFRQAEKVWIVEKDKLLSQISMKKSISAGVNVSTLSNFKTGGRNGVYQSPRDKINDCNTTTGLYNNIHSLEAHAWAELNQQKKIQLEKTIENLENQLDQQQKLSDMYRDQVSCNICLCNLFLNKIM
ncbi:Coiled-coil domain-containing protein isoform 1 [Schistosoma japonicum]|uniref:Coiled-coil domain-containing protein isoform 1 n=1 Tax=Schistosoma japonicum TaxID=6182 RepID=A0A4Z2D817_SCHJA|nr:Coiled-coil domain-containing protein isoform 1 [Schistosoma japonicum]